MMLMVCLMHILLRESEREEASEKEEKEKHEVEGERNWGEKPHWLIIYLFIIIYLREMKFLRNSSIYLFIIYLFIYLFIYF